MKPVLFAVMSPIQKKFALLSKTPITDTLSLFSERYYFNYGAPVHLMLSLSNHITVERDALFYQRKAIPNTLFNDFLDALTIFEQDSGFREFYKAHIPMYKTMVELFIADYEKYSSHVFCIPS